MEKWKEIKNFKYLVSNYGRLKNKNSGKIRTLNNDYGYSVRINNKVTYLSIHNIKKMYLTGRIFTDDLKEQNYQKEVNEKVKRQREKIIDFVRKNNDVFILKGHKIIIKNKVYFSDSKNKHRSLAHKDLTVLKNLMWMLEKEVINHKKWERFYEGRFVKINSVASML